jgi:hypothetical protein
VGRQRTRSNYLRRKFVKPFKSLSVALAVATSEGFRRPGYIVSVEPSVSVPLGRWSLALSVPVAVYRNRLQSVADQEQTAATGIYQHSDVIYPNFSIICGISKRW